MSAGWAALLAASAFNRLGQFASSPGNRAYCYAELVVSSLVQVLILPTHEEMTRLIWPGCSSNQQSLNSTYLDFFCGFVCCTTNPQHSDVMSRCSIAFCTTRFTTTLHSKLKEWIFEAKPTRYEGKLGQTPIATKPPIRQIVK